MDESRRTTIKWTALEEDLAIIKEICRNGEQVYFIRSGLPDIQDLIRKQTYRLHLVAMIRARILPVDLLRLLREFV
jgi:hypothetical protein